MFNLFNVEHDTFFMFDVIFIDAFLHTIGTFDILDKTIS